MAAVTTAAAENGLAELEAQYPDARRSELARFLKVRYGSVAEASAQYAAYLEWRRVTFPLVNDGTITELIHNRVFYQLPGVANDGSAIVVFHGPHHKPKRFTKEETVRSIVAVTEPIFNSRPDDVRFTLIMYQPKGSPIDLKGLRTLALTFKTYYPGTLVKAIVFPIGPLTPTIWRMAKVFLGKRTTSKVVLMRGGATPSALAGYLPADSTPSLFLSDDAKRQLGRTSDNEPGLLPSLEKWVTLAKEDELRPSKPGEDSEVDEMSGAAGEGRAL